MPAAPTALRRVSLSCSDNHKEFFLLSVLFHLVPFLYLENKQAIHTRGGQLQTTYKPSICMSDHLSSAFSWQREHHNVTLGILSSDSLALCRAKPQQHPHKAPGLPGGVIRTPVFFSSSRLYWLLGFGVFFSTLKRVQLVRYSPALPCAGRPTSCTSTFGQYLKFPQVWELSSASVWSRAPTYLQPPCPVAQPPYCPLGFSGSQ